MTQQRNTNKIQALIFIRRLHAYLLVLGYSQYLQAFQDKEQEDKTVSFAYDPFGRRISKTVQYPSLRGEAEAISDDGEDKSDNDYEKPKTTHYLYDNEDIIAEYNSKGKITARYTHGLGIDEPLSVKKKDHAYYYHADGLGSITTLTNERGKVVQTYDYDSFGNLKNYEQKIKQPYTYTAREWDSETKLYYYRARYYDAKTGRFLEKDPILSPTFKETHICSINRMQSNKGIPSFEQIKKDARNFNPYVYAYANPLKYTDPNGLSCTGVPDYPFGFNFEPCCQGHDSCYDGCGKTRKECDQKFYDCMINQCSQEPDVLGRRTVCETWARNYYIGVRLGGWFFYSGSQ